VKHAILSASSMHRWAACPGSVQLIAKLVEAALIDPNRSTGYATDGRGAHELGERCLRNGVQADSFISQYMNTEDTPVEVTEEMAQAVQVYVDYVRSLSITKGDTLYFIEQTFDLSRFYAGLFGTADCAAYHLPTRTLHVVDFKYGAGVPVEATGNPQLRYYGLGALVRLGDMALPQPMPTNVELVIVQPRATHTAGPIRREAIPSAKLLMWIDDLIAAAKATEPESAPLQPGEHCRFCPAAARCPKLHEDALAAAQIAFAPVAKPDATQISGPMPVKELSDEQLRRALMAAQLIEPWLKELYAHAQEILERGDEVPGWKLVAKRAIRHWAMDSVITEPELVKLGLAREDLYEPRELRSPAQVEKLLPRHRHAELKPLVAKQSSGVTLAPITDPRPAVQRALPFSVIV
jgi:Protein of unknown function (DUF2800)